MTLDRLCRYPLPPAFRAENAALALRAPTMPHAHAAGGGATPWLAAFAPPAVRGIFSTILRASLGGLQRKHRWRTSCVDAVLALSWGELTENRKQRQHVRPGFLFPKQEVVMDFVIFFTGIAAVACALYYLKKTNPNKPHAH